MTTIISDAANSNHFFPSNLVEKNLVWARISCCSKKRNAERVHWLVLKGVHWPTWLELRPLDLPEESLVKEKNKYQKKNCQGYDQPSRRLSLQLLLTREWPIDKLTDKTNKNKINSREVSLVSKANSNKA